MLFLIGVTGFFLSAGAQVVQVDHLRKETPDAQKAADFFAKTIRMPVVTGVRTASHAFTAAVWFGNMAFYLSDSKKNTAGNQSAIIALEPVQHNDALVRLLDEYGVNYAAPLPVTGFNILSEQAEWSDFLLKDLSAAALPVVIADYTTKEFVNAKRKEAKQILEQSDGSALGIRLVKKIVVGSTDPEKNIHAWVSIPGVRRKEGNIFSFFNGPDILIEKADQDAIKEVVIKVKSLQAAKDFLLEKKSLLLNGNTVLIDPANTAGIRMVLEE